jgi:hypothetical protein
MVYGLLTIIPVPIGRNVNREPVWALILEPSVAMSWAVNAIEPLESTHDDHHRFSPR